MQETAQVFSSEERTMINRVLDLQSLTVRQAIKPLAEVVSVSTTVPVSEAMRICRETKLTRLPVYETREGNKRIVGLLSFASLLYLPDLDSTRLVGDYIKPALYLEENLRLEVALRRMQRGGQRLAIVLGRDRRETGILSLQDVLQIIFGRVSL